MFFTLFGTVIFVSLSQFRNAMLSISRRFDESVTPVSDLQSINANAPIYLTFAPNFTEVRADALPKAPSPKDLSEEGNVTDVSFLASVKATLSITVTVEGIENVLSVFASGYCIITVLFLLYRTPF